jgi:hypothetical protein
VTLSIEERRTLGARAQQVARKIMRRTPGLDEASAVAAAKRQVGFDKPDFTPAQSIEGTAWQEGERYPRWLLPTHSLNGKGGMPYAPSKRQARSNA